MAFEQELKRNGNGKCLVNASWLNLNIIFINDILTGQIDDIYNDLTNKRIWKAELTVVNSALPSDYKYILKSSKSETTTIKRKLRFYLFVNNNTKLNIRHLMNKHLNVYWEA